MAVDHSPYYNKIIPTPSLTDITLASSIIRCQELGIVTVMHEAEYIIQYIIQSQDIILIAVPARSTRAIYVTLFWKTIHLGMHIQNLWECSIENFSDFYKINFFAYSDKATIKPSYCEISLP